MLKKNQKMRPYKELSPEPLRVWPVALGPERLKHQLVALLEVLAHPPGHVFKALAMQDDGRGKGDAVRPVVCLRTVHLRL